MIIRHPHNKDNPYFMLNRTACNDENLSMKALGLHTYLMSKPDGWTIVVKQLMSRFNCGETAVRSALKELKGFGYTDVRVFRDEKGRIEDRELLIYETLTVENLNLGKSTDLVSSDVLESKETTKDLDEEFGQIIATYQDNIGIITPIIGEEIGDAMENYPTSWILEAMAEATTREARSWKYVLGCLKNWKRDGKSTSEKKEGTNQAPIEVRGVGGEHAQ